MPHRSAHFTMCPIHQTSRNTRDKECVKCHKTEVLAVKKSREAKEKSKEADKKSRKDDDDFFKRTGKDQKPRSDKDRDSGVKLGNLGQIVPNSYHQTGVTDC